ncbi:hypothetical protein AHiyo1_50110 [Arthrobacter sp. Hiyo1]|nr:hypothetical protein AHiyo1_50110 [Arthrobacter sp. Hiyo1]
MPAPLALSRPPQVQRSSPHTSLVRPQGRPPVDTGRREQRLIFSERSEWACRAQRGEGAPATGTNPSAMPTNTSSKRSGEAERSEGPQDTCCQVCLCPFSFSTVCSTAGALAEVWNARLSGELVGTYRFGDRQIFRAASVRTGAVPLLSGHFDCSLFWCFLALPYECPFVAS